MAARALCGAAALVARAPRPVAAGARQSRREVSQRHLSFLEVGRTAPSREMVLRLAATLDLPLRAAECAAARRRLCAGVARERAGRAGAGDRRPRARLHAGAAGALSRLRRRPPLEPAAPQQGRAAPRRLPHRHAAGSRPTPRNPVNLADALRGARRAAPADRQLARGGALFPARRAGRRAGRRHRRDGGAARPPARLSRCAAHLGGPVARKSCKARCSPSTSPRAPRRCASSPRSPRSARRRT